MVGVKSARTFKIILSILVWLGFLTWLHSAPNCTQLVRFERVFPWKKVLCYCVIFIVIITCCRTAQRPTTARKVLVFAVCWDQTQYILKRRGNNCGRRTRLRVMRWRRVHGYAPLQIYMLHGSSHVVPVTDLTAPSMIQGSGMRM